MTIHETTAKLAAVNARIAASALKSNADCIRLATRIQELEGALRDLIKWADDSGLSHTKSGGFGAFTYAGTEYSVYADARSILAKGN